MYSKDLLMILKRVKFFAMQKLRDVVKDLEWDSNKTHGYWIDVMRI
jgi:hypothetical protein